MVATAAISQQDHSSQFENGSQLAERDSKNKLKEGTVKENRTDYQSYRGKKPSTNTHTHTLTNTYTESVNQQMETSLTYTMIYFIPFYALFLSGVGNSVEGLIGDRH